MGKTFAEKVLAAKSGQPEVVPGQIVIVQPDHLLTHDNASRKRQSLFYKHLVADTGSHVEKVF